jgi:cysteine desulfurase / selenocysteine lyase
MNYKKNFPIFKNNKNLIYLDSASTSQKPQVVIDAISEYYGKYNANIHRGLYKIAEKASEEVEEVRKKIAQFINSKSEDEIIFTKGTTEGINLLAYTLGNEIIQNGDKIVATIMDHHSNFVPWQQLARRKNAQFGVVNIKDNGQLDTNDLSKKIKDAKILALPHISNMLGIINDLEKSIKDIRKMNKEIIIVVDGAQAIPHMKVDIQKIDADFYVFSGHKMLAATGIGVLYGKKKFLDKMKPFLYGGDMVREVTFENTTFAPLPNKFEGGTLNIEGIITLGAAIDYINSIGIEKITRHEEALTKYCIEQLKKIDGINIFGPQQRAGIVSFTIKNIHAHDIAQVLADENICVRSGHHCTMPLHKRLGIPASVRASFYIYNDEKEIEKLRSVLKKIVKLFK